MGASASHDGGRRRAKCTMVKAGDAVPLVTFKCRVRDPRSQQEENPFKWKNVTTRDLFPRGKRVVLFAVPGSGRTEASGWKPVEPGQFQEG